MRKVESGKLSAFCLFVGGDRPYPLGPPTPTFRRTQDPISTDLSGQSQPDSDMPSASELRVHRPRRKPQAPSVSLGDQNRAAELRFAA